MKKVLLVFVLIIDLLYAQKLDLAPPPVYEPSAFTWNKWHQYLGLGAVAAGVVAGVSGATIGGDSKLHKIAGVTGTALAGAAVVSGFLLHWDDINLDFGLKDPDNLHILLGLTGAALYGSAIKSNDKTAPIHAVAGALGTITMISAIYITW